MPSAATSRPPGSRTSDPRCTRSETSRCRSRFPWPPDRPLCAKSFADPWGGAYPQAGALFQQGFDFDALRTNGDQPGSRAFSRLIRPLQKGNDQGTQAALQLMVVGGGQKAHLLGQAGDIEALEVMVFEQTGSCAGPGGAVGFACVAGID